MHIAEEIKKAKALSPQDKYNQFRQIAFSIAEDIENIQLTEIDQALTLLNQVIKVIGFPQKLTRARSKLVLHKMTLLGLTDIKVITKQNNTIPIESGTIIVGDPDVVNA